MNTIQNYTKMLQNYRIKDKMLKEMVDRLSSEIKVDKK